MKLMASEEKEKVVKGKEYTQSRGTHGSDVMKEKPRNISDISGVRCWTTTLTEASAKMNM